MRLFTIACATAFGLTALAATANAESEPPPAKVGPTVRVHIDSPQSVQLYRRPAQVGQWFEACSSPCDADMPLGDEYRIAGSGIAQSSDFRLNGSPGERVVLDVDPAHRSTVVGGGVLVGAGIFVGIVGFYAAFIQSLAGAIGCDPQFGPCSGGKLGTATVALLIGGASVTVIGILIMVSNGSTGISQEARARTAPPRALDAFKREPTWRSPSTDTQSPRPTVGIPIFSHAF